MSTRSNELLTDGEPLVVEGGGFEPEPLADWHSLSVFRVQIHKNTGVNAEVYANGLQQVPIEVVVQARDRNNVVVNLTQEQLMGVNGVRLIHYENNVGVPLCTHTHDARFVYEWNPTRDDGTELEPDAQTDEAPTSTGQIVKIYVRKKDLSSTWIAAEITSPSGAKFRTNTPNPTDGKFDSWVTIKGREPKIYPWNCSTMTSENAYNATYWDVDLYYIRFIDTKLRIVASRHYGYGDHDGYHYNWLKGGNQTLHVCYGAGAARPVTHRSLAGTNSITLNINKHPGQATASRILDARDYGCVSYQGCVMGYIDQHGNESKVFVRGTSDGNMLYLDDPGLKGTELPPEDDDLSAGEEASG